uniref:Glycosyl transferase, group 1 n=1 Tax=Solibacter usitatus (strain Ellin6076) TaxID=234267 RepID=Q01S28_SOLUE
MNLLLLDQFSDLGGAQKNLLELLPAIREAGWRTLVGLPGEGELFEQVRALGFEAERIECGPYESGRKSAADVARFMAGTPRLAAQMRRMATRVDAGLVYLNGPRLLPAAAMASMGRPALFHSHSYLGPGVMRRLAAAAIGRMKACVIAQCEFVAAPWGPHVSVVYNGVAGPARISVRAPGGVPRVGCIGRIAPEKGQREFVAAAARIHRALPDCRFTIYGAPLFGNSVAEHYAARVRNEAAGLPVDFAGWVEDVYAAMEQLDLLLVPSAGHEATTRVILEAFAAGVPVVAFPSGGIPEVVDHGVTGMLAKGVEEMAECAIELLTGERRAAMVAAARESWERRFTLERYRREMMAAMERAIRAVTVRERLLI